MRLIIASIEHEYVILILYKLASYSLLIPMLSTYMSSKLHLYMLWCAAGASKSLRLVSYYDYELNASRLRIYLTIEIGKNQTKHENAESEMNCCDRSFFAQPDGRRVCVSLFRIY